MSFLEVITGSGAALVVLMMLALALLVPSRQQRREKGAVTAEREPEPLPEPKVPSDTSRPYPRPQRSRSKLNRVCPVCGTGSETTELDGKVLGWPAHASCAEWLGDWKPPRTVPPPPHRPTGAVTGERSVAVSGNVTGIVSTGDGAVNGALRPKARSARWHAAASGGSFPVADAEDIVRAQEMVMNGLASVDEARQRLAGEGTAAVRALDGVPSYREWCTCGHPFNGTAKDIARLLQEHRESGACPHSRAGRRT